MSHSYFDPAPFSGLTPEQLAKAKKAWQARENGRLSKGPLTEDGKRTAAQNARKHGFAGATFVLDVEDQEAYAMHLDAYFQSLPAVTQLECDYVRRIANAQWRYDRLTAIECGLLDLEIDHQGTNADAFLENLELRHYLALGFMEKVNADNALELCRRYISSAARDCDRAIKMFYLIKSERLNAMESVQPVPEEIAPRPKAPEKHRLPNEPTPIRPNPSLKPVATAKLDPKSSRPAGKERRKPQKVA